MSPTHFNFPKCIQQCTGVRPAPYFVDCLFLWEEFGDNFLREDPFDVHFPSKTSIDSDGQHFIDAQEHEDIFYDATSASPLTISAFTTADEDSHNMTASFDTDSSFWVCDNSGTSHICNDISMFHGKLVPSAYHIGTATGTCDSSKMGTVIVHLTNDEGVAHSFLLSECIYMPESSFNLLSVHRLAEHFPDDNGLPDKRGTGIMSVFEEHTLFWNDKKHSKTFVTANSGLPEILLNAGYAQLMTYMSHVCRVYDDTIYWAFSLDTEKKTLDEGSNIDLDLTDALSFLEGMKFILNDGEGTKDLVTFTGLDYVDGMQQTCNITRADGTESIVYPEMLHFIENPDIVSISKTLEEYCRDISKITPADIKHLLNPQPLSPLQAEMMSYHNKLHHLPFPELIILVGKGQIPKRLTTLKGHTPICVACIFGSAHKQSWRTKSKTKHPIRKESDNEPGARISMDQIVSAEPGLIPQMSGGLTNL